MLPVWLVVTIIGGGNLEATLPIRSRDAIPMFCRSMVRGQRMDLSDDTDSRSSLKFRLDYLIDPFAGKSPSPFIDPPALLRLSEIIDPFAGSLIVSPHLATQVCPSSQTGLTQGSAPLQMAPELLDPFGLRSSL